MFILYSKNWYLSTLYGLFRVSHFIYEICYNFIVQITHVVFLGSNIFSCTCFYTIWAFILILWMLLIHGHIQFTDLKEHQLIAWGYILTLYLILRAYSICDRCDIPTENAFSYVHLVLCLKSSLKKFYGRYGDLTKQYEVPSLESYTTFWRMAIYSETLHWWDFTSILTLYWSGPFYLIRARPSKIREPYSNNSVCPSVCTSTLCCNAITQKYLNVLISYTFTSYTGRG